MEGSFDSKYSPMFPDTELQTHFKSEQTFSQDRKKGV